MSSDNPVAPLRVALVLGSTRTEGPPRPTNLGNRIGLFLSALVRSQGHDIDIIDPIEEDLPLLQRPHFTYGAADVPPRLDALASRLKTADAYIMVTPEYNHAPSPALLNLLNHFGNRFAFCTCAGNKSLTNRKNQ